MNKEETKEKDLITSLIYNNEVIAKIYKWDDFVKMFWEDRYRNSSDWFPSVRSAQAYARKWLFPAKYGKWVKDK